jgi:membrane associated rhomboid family serine protease
MFARLPPATRAILIVNVLVFIAQQYPSDTLMRLFALWPLGERFHPWQLISYAFLHGSMAHIFLNMFALLMFGSPLEQQLFGTRRFTIYYFASVIGAAVTQLAVQAATHSPYDTPTIGASGGVFGLLLAFAIFFPRAKLLLYFAIPMPAWLFVVLYGALELFLGVTGTQEGVAHFAHLGGMLGGAVVILYWRARGLLQRL